MKNYWPYIHRKDRFNDSCYADGEGHMFPADLGFLGMVCPICQGCYDQKLGSRKWRKRFRSRIKS